jgi:FKBP-type peptidyl-prolyl cis-trans isomerase SlyD
MSAVEQDSVVSVIYTGTFSDSGEVFDSNVNKQPLVFLVGHGNMIEGFEQEMLGAAVGETREFTLTPERAYGIRDEANVQSIPRSQFPEGMELEVGMILGAQSDQGPMQFTVVDVNDDLVIVDLNHQMAGHTLHFNVEVVEIREATSDELAHGHAHGPGHHH